MPMVVELEEFKAVRPLEDVCDRVEILFRQHSLQACNRKHRHRLADVLVLGSPVYFHYPTGVYRAFLERLAFPVYSYHYENGQPLVCRDKVIETANIFTMNIPEKWLDEWKYPQVLESNTQTLKTVFGASESLYACDTYQFTDYSRYDVTLFDEAAKRAHRDVQFPIDLANARALGKRLVEKALANALQAK